MAVNQFLLSLLHSLSQLDFVEKVDLHSEVFVIKGRVILKEGRFLHVYFNEMTGTTAFALIDRDKRVWGIDFDNIRGWHVHPLEDSESHKDIKSMTVEEIMSELGKVWPHVQK